MAVQVAILFFSFYNYLGRFPLDCFQMEGNKPPPLVKVHEPSFQALLQKNMKWWTSKVKRGQITLGYMSLLSHPEILEQKPCKKAVWCFYPHNHRKRIDLLYSTVSVCSVWSKMTVPTSVTKSLVESLKPWGTGAFQSSLSCPGSWRVGWARLGY